MFPSPKGIHLASTLAAVAAVASAVAGCGQAPHPRAPSAAPTPLAINAANGTGAASLPARSAAASFSRAYARSADGREPGLAAATPALARQLRANAHAIRGHRPLPPLHLVALSVSRRRPDAAAAVATFRPGPGLPFRVGFTVERLGERWRVTSVDGNGAGS